MKDCRDRRDYNRERRKNPAFVVREKERQISYGKLGDRDPVALLTYDAKKRAKRRHRPYEITKDDIRAIWPRDGQCPYCTTKMIRHTMQAPSLDEVIVGLGYVKGNVEVVCRQCNSHKNNYPVEWFERIAARMHAAVSGIMRRD